MIKLEIEIDPARLLSREVAGRCVRERRFRMWAGGEAFYVAVEHVPRSAAECYTEPEEEDRPPADDEVVQVVAGAFALAMKGGAA